MGDRKNLREQAGFIQPSTKETHAAAEEAAEKQPVKEKNMEMIPYWEC